MGFYLIYWAPMSGSYFFMGAKLEKCGNYVKNGRSSGRIRPDWGNTAWADTAGLGSIGLKYRLIVLLITLYIFHFTLRAGRGNSNQWDYNARRHVRVGL